MHTTFLLDIFILLSFVWVARKLGEFFRLPPLFGEIFAGLIAGPLFLGLVHETEAIFVLAELGIFFLMFHSGLESDPADIAKSFWTALWVALGGSILAFGGGWAVTAWFGYDLQTSIVVGLALTITAVAISIRLFKDERYANSRIAHITMAAAIMIEIVSLVIFSIFTQFAEAGSLDPSIIAWSLVKIIAYFVIVFVVGRKYFRYLYKVLYKGNKGFSFTIIIALGFAVLAELAGLHFIVGAYLAGLFLHKEIFEREVYEKIEDRLYGLSYSLLGPIFFALLAFDLEFTVLHEAPLFVLAVFIVAVLSKLIGSGLAAYWRLGDKLESLAIGFAMNSRGAVEIIIASIALRAGIIDNTIFSVLVFVVFGTALVSVLGIRPIIRRLKAA